MSGLGEYLAGSNDGPGGTSMPNGRRPCVKCGGPKPAGRGLLYCATCERSPQYVPKTTPCRACGGTEGKQRGKQYCDECKALRVWREEKLVKARSIVLRHPCSRCGARKSPGRGKQLCDSCEAADRAPRKCLTCGVNPVRAERKRLCVSCYEEAQRHTRAITAARQRERVLAGKTQEIARRSRQRRQQDPARRERHLEDERMRRRIKAAREGREIRPYSPRRTEFQLPARALAIVISELAEDSDIGTICELAGINERSVSRWRTGSIERITSDEADAILTGLDLLWWEIWREDTVRVPLFVVHVYGHQMKTQRNGPRLRRRVKQHRRPYGDQGPDRALLAEIAKRMAGEAMAA